MSTIQSSTVLVGESGDLPALKTNEVELADVNDEKAPPEKRRLSRADSMSGDESCCESLRARCCC